MVSEKFTTTYAKKIERGMAEAAEIIKNGGVVVYPTETVYGLGASATNRIAILKVYEAKKRPINNPLSVAVKDLKQADELVYTNSYARKLAKAFLPGPLTIILKKKAILPKELTGDCYFCKRIRPACAKDNTRGETTTWRSCQPYSGWRRVQNRGAFYCSRSVC